MKILCLGNNTSDTDTKTRALAQESQYVCHGLLSELDGPVTAEHYEMSGYYHSTVVDISYGRLLEIMNSMDQVIILDQPPEQWDHPAMVYKTLQLARQTQTPVQFQDPKLSQGFSYFSDLVKRNPSFCIFPFIEMLVNYDYTTVCCRSKTPITPLSDLKDFAQDPNYLDIRHRMLAGELLPEHCNACYQQEKHGMISARQQETVEWAQRLDLHSTQDLERIQRPAYYEIRPDNRCNLLCRSCSPENSHLIGREYQKLNLMSSIAATNPKNRTGFGIIDYEDLHKVYVSGGEPTMMPQFYEFLQQCIDRDKTHIEILVNTNGNRLSSKLKDLLKHFTNLSFIFSVDGHQRLNFYIRWPSNWSRMLQNWHYLVANGHRVSVNTTVSIYNVARLHRLYEFVDREFASTLIHWNILTNPSHLSPYLYPDHEGAVASLKRIQQTQCYRDDPLFASAVQSMLTYFERAPFPKDLTKFFAFNDRLDRSRKVRLEDYVPELDKYRSMLYNQTT